MLRSLLFRCELRGHQRATRAAAALTGLSILGAGFWFVLAFRMNRQSRRAAVLPPTKGTLKVISPMEEFMAQESGTPGVDASLRGLRGEPECEVSPEGSPEDSSDDEGGASCQPR